MPENQIGPVTSNERIEVLDVLRGLAVGGILIGNMQWFSGYGPMPPAVEAQGPVIDQVTHFLVHFFVEGKFYSIFSFLFGFGFALQIARAGERGDEKATLFKRRLFWLLVIGVLHAYLLWAGDILSVYALMGFILLLFRKKPDDALLRWAFWLMVIPVATYLLLYGVFVAFAPPGTVEMVETAKADSWANSVRTIPQSSYLEIISGYNLQYIAGRYIGLIAQMRLPKILAMFLLGFYAYRRGFFQDTEKHKPFIRRVLIYGLILGMTGNLILVATTGNEADFPPSVAGWVAVVGYSFGVPALALGIAAAVTLLWQREPWRRLLAVLAPVGRMALTNYLLQTVICVFLFYGFGLGLYGRFGATASTLIALAVFASQIVLSAVWLRLFAFGPMEWIWRQLTYRRRLALRLRSRAA